MQGHKKSLSSERALSPSLRHCAIHGTIRDVPELGYTRLGNMYKARAIEEMRHAEGFIEHIIFLTHSSG